MSAFVKTKTTSLSGLSIEQVLFLSVSDLLLVCGVYVYLFGSVCVQGSRTTAYHSSCSFSRDLMAGRWRCVTRTESDMIDMTEFLLRAASDGSTCRTDKSFLMTCGSCVRLFALPVRPNLSVLFNRQYSLEFEPLNSEASSSGSSEIEAYEEGLEPCTGVDLLSTT